LPEHFLKRSITNVSEELFVCCCRSANVTRFKTLDPEEQQRLLTSSKRLQTAFDTVPFLPTNTIAAAAAAADANASLGAAPRDVGSFITAPTAAAAAAAGAVAAGLGVALAGQPLGGAAGVLPLLMPVGGGETAPLQNIAAQQQQQQQQQSGQVPAAASLQLGSASSFNVALNNCSAADLQLLQQQLSTWLTTGHQVLQMVHVAMQQTEQQTGLGADAGAGGASSSDGKGGGVQAAGGVRDAMHALGKGLHLEAAQALGGGAAAGGDGGGCTAGQEQQLAAERQDEDIQHDQEQQQQEQHSPGSTPIKAKR
jgi:hypothetical protein